MCLYCNNNLYDKNSIKIINFFKKQKIISDNDNIKLVYGKPLLWGINGFAVLVTDSKMIVFNNFPKVVLHNYSLSSIKNVFIENNQLNINFLDRENGMLLTLVHPHDNQINIHEILQGYKLSSWKIGFLYSISGLLGKIVPLGKMFVIFGWLKYKLYNLRDK